MRVARQLFVLTLMLIVAVPVGAQSKFRVGAYGGVKWGDLSGDNKKLVDANPELQQVLLRNQAHFEGGVQGEFHMSSVFVLRVQMGLRQDGTEIGLQAKQGQTAPTDKANITLHYFDMPIMAVAQFGNASVKPFVTSGFSLALLTRAQQEIGQEKTDLKKETRTANLTWNIGTGLHIPVGRNMVYLEGRFALGLTKVFDLRSRAANFTSGDQTAVVTPDLRTRGFNVLAGITLPIGRG